MNRRFGPPALGEVSQSGNIFFNKNVMSAKISTDINHVGFQPFAFCRLFKDETSRADPIHCARHFQPKYGECAANCCCEQMGCTVSAV